MGPVNHRKHYKSLDGLRGLAIVMVLGFHLYPPSQRDLLAHVFRIGWLGVDLFFVLSGFLITGILYDTVQEPQFFRNFYARRALRLFPAYVVVVAGVLVVSHFLGGKMTVWTLPYFVYGSNIIRNLGLNKGVAWQIDVSHFWSLAIEEQFYMLWPMVIFFARTKRRILWICLTGIVLAVTLRFLVIGLHVSSETAYFELPTRLDSLLAGGALSLVVRSRYGVESLKPWLLNVAMAAGLAVLLTCCAASNSSLPYSAAMVRFGYLSASMVFVSLIALALQPGTWANRLGNVSVLRVFGRYSYSLYLLHFLPEPEYSRFLVWVKLRPSDRLSHGIDLGIFVLYVAAMLGLAALSYHGFELRFLKRKRDFAYRDEQQEHYLQPDESTIVPL